MTDYASLRTRYFDRRYISEYLQMNKDITHYGEIKSEYSHKWKRGIKARITKNDTLEIGVCLGKYLRGQNYENLSYNDLNVVIRKLCQEFRIDAQKTTIHKVEFCVIMEVKDCPKQIAEKMLWCGKNPFQYFDNKGSANQSFGKVCKLSHSCIKCYSTSEKYLKMNKKSELYRLFIESEYYEKKLLKFEIGTRKMDFLNKRGISIINLNDLLNKDKLEALGEVLRNVYDRVHKREELKPEPYNRLTDKRKLYIQEHRNFSTWREMDYQVKNKELSRNTRSKRWARYNELIDSIKTDYFTKLGEDITKTWNELLNTPVTIQESKMYHILPMYRGENGTILIKEIIKELSELSEYQKELCEDRKCVMCETDISHKRSDAITCSDKCRHAKSNVYHNMLRCWKMYIETKYTMPTLFDDTEMDSLTDLSLLENAVKKIQPKKETLGKVMLPA